MDLVALLPWWAGVLLAGLGYVGLHAITLRPLTIPAAPPGQMGEVMVRSIAHAAAGVGQYVVPLICLCGAAISAWRRRQRKTLLAQTQAIPAAAGALDGMSWQDFELLVGEAFRREGYAVHEKGGGGADGGVDLVLSRGGERFLVQCKQWRAYKVGVNVVRELYGVMAARGAAGGFVVTSGRFTEEARQFADGRNVQLVDGVQLHALIRTAKSVERAMSAGDQPACPTCSKAMTRRLARQGANAGQSFWGCSGYPGCRGTRAIE